MKLDCSSVAERLPWLFNGSLDEDERDQIAAHLRDCQQCRHEAAEVAWLCEVIEGHPPSTLIVAWVTDCLPAADAVAVAAHVKKCEQCADEATLVGEAEALAISFNPVTESVVPISALRRWRRATACAVAVAAACLIFGLVVWRDAMWHGGGPLSSELRAQSYANVPVLELLPASLRLRSASGRIDLARDQPTATLILVPEAAYVGSYLLRVSDEKGHELLRVEELKPSAAGDLTLTVTPATFPVGILNFELSQGDETVASYEVRITDARSR